MKMPASNRSKRWLALLAALCGAVALAGPSRAAGDVPAAAFADPERRAKLLAALPRIEALLADSMAGDGSPPGMSYAVVIDGQAVLVRGLGVRDATDKVMSVAGQVAPDTVFRIASMSKSFTAMAVLLLRDEGKLALDDPAERHVPELRSWKLPTTDSAPVTLRQLLAHVAGLPEDNPQGDRTLAVTPQRLSAWLAGGVPFSSAPGSAFEYSNLGFVILGRVVTNVSGKPYQAFVRDRLLLPLGMRDTRYDPAGVPPAKLARGHRRDGTAWVDEPLLADGEAGAMGGLLTTAPDLARYVAFMLSAWPPRDEAERGPVLRRTLREMQSGQGFPDLYSRRQLPGGPATALAESYGFGLSAFVDCNFGRVVDHGGGLPGFGSVMRWLPDHGVGLLVLGNSTYFGAGGPARTVLRELKATGALLPRVAAASPALQAAFASVTTTLLAADDGATTAPSWAAENLALDEAWPQRKAAFAEQRAPLGACKPAELTAENPLRGRQRLACDKGWLDVTLTLAPTNPPLVQSLSFSAGAPLQPALQDSVAAVLNAMAQGAHALPLAPALERRNVAAELEATRIAVGSCRIGEVLSGDGHSKARVRLACDRGGGTDLALSIDKAGRISRLALTPAPGGSACVP